MFFRLNNNFLQILILPFVPQ